MIRLTDQQFDMITITIKSGEQLDQTEFDSIADLQEHLALHRDFSEAYQSEILKRSHELESGQVQPISAAETQRAIDELLR